MTQLLSFDETGFQFAWDSTSLSSFVTCPRKYYYSMLQGWTAEQKSVHLIFGGHYASALEHFHKHRAAGIDHDDALRLVVREALEATWDYEKNVPQDWMHSSKTRDTLIRSIVWYLETFQDDPMKTVILSDGRAAVEYSFSIDLSEDYTYCGHIDRLVTYGDNNDYPALWSDHASIAAKSATTYGSQTIPVAGFRVKCTASSSGVVRLRAVQAGA